MNQHVSEWIAVAIAVTATVYGFIILISKFLT